MQINPPFDGSAPCPACQSELRGISAYIHNFLVGWPAPKAFVKLNDLRAAYPTVVKLTVDHPISQELLSAAVALVTACDGMIDHGDKVTWTPKIFERVQAVVPLAEAAERAFDELSEAHFRDYRHSHGEPNILRESRGSRRIHFLPDRDYNYTVEVVAHAGDLRHVPCGTHLALHQHFRDNLSRDPTFYAKVFCPTCKINAPFEQFDTP